MGPANGGPINLKAARLQDAFLRFATLSAANLKAADMSGADLVHARFDDADLSAANLSNANLDHADFSGANLSNVNFSGASLCHAKNLTRAQLEATILSDSTILPADLQELVSSWSARRQTNTNAFPKLLELRPKAQACDVVEISSPKHRVWKAGTLFLLGASIITGVVWWHTNEAARPTLDAPREATPALTEPSPDTEGQNLQPSPDQALLEKKLDPEPPSSAEAEIPPIPSSAITVDGTDGRPEQRPLSGADADALVPQETSDEPQASDAVNSLEQTAAPNEPARTPAGEDYGSSGSQTSEAVPRVSGESAMASTPELPAETSDLSVTGSVESAAVTHGDPVVPPLHVPESSALVTTPGSLSRHGTVPDSPAAPALPDTPSASVTEPPAETLGLNTPAPLSLSVAITPSPTSSAGPPSEEIGVETELPRDAASIPMPVRKPVTETSVSNSGAEISATPGRESVAHAGGSRIAKGVSLPRSRSRLCVPIIGRYFEGQCYQ